MEKAKKAARKRKKAGRPRSLSRKQASRLARDWDSWIAAAGAESRGDLSAFLSIQSELTGLSKQTLRKYLRERGVGRRS